MALTLIAFVGSVFSPYYAWARRRGQADAENHCALNLALYRRPAGSSRFQNSFTGLKLLLLLALIFAGLFMVAGTPQPARAMPRRGRTPTPPS